MTKTKFYDKTFNNKIKKFETSGNVDSCSVKLISKVPFAESHTGRTGVVVSVAFTFIPYHLSSEK
jgi:hypothetical protein